MPRTRKKLDLRITLKVLLAIRAGKNSQRAIWSHTGISTSTIQPYITRLWDEKYLEVSIQKGESGSPVMVYSLTAKGLQLAELGSKVLEFGL